LLVSISNFSVFVLFPFFIIFFVSVSINRIEGFLLMDISASACKSQFAVYGSRSVHTSWHTSRSVTPRNLSRAPMTTLTWCETRGCSIISSTVARLASLGCVTYHIQVANLVQYIRLTFKTLLWNVDVVFHFNYLIVNMYYLMTDVVGFMTSTQPLG